MRPPKLASSVWPPLASSRSSLSQRTLFGFQREPFDAVRSKRSGGFERSSADQMVTCGMPSMDGSEMPAMCLPLGDIAKPLST